VDYFYLAIAILAEVAATSALKASDAFTRPTFSAIVIVGYGTAYYFLSLALRSLPLALAYAVWACAGTVLIGVTSLIAFKQSLDGAGVLGIALILIGAVILNGFSRLGAR
jgi:small multidrug resistance pump